MAELFHVLRMKKPGNGNTESYLGTLYYLRYKLFIRVKQKRVVHWTSKFIILVLMYHVNMNIDLFFITQSQQEQNSLNTFGIAALYYKYFAFDSLSAIIGEETFRYSRYRMSEGSHKTKFICFSSRYIISVEKMKNNILITRSFWRFYCGKK